MTLGEALTNRADLQKRIAQLASRLQASGVVQEGDAPPEDPAELLAEPGELTSELERLITAIDLTNAASRLPDGRPLTAALAERDVLALRQSVLRQAVDSVTQTQAGAREGVRLPDRTVTPSTRHRALSTGHGHHRVLGRAARVGEGTLRRASAG
jgi:hypothetical protein